MTRQHFTPREYQHAIIDHTLDVPRCGVWAGMGMGKSESTLTALGTLELVIHPLLNGLQQTGTMLVMDMPALKLAYMEGRDTIPEAYGVTPSQQGQVSDSGLDAQGGSLLSELAVELINPSSCALVTGLTAGIA